MSVTDENQAQMERKINGVSVETGVYRMPEEPAGLRMDPR